MNNKRRGNKVSKNLDSYLLLIILSIFFHINPPPIGAIELVLDFKAISYLLIIYTGYKYGRKWGAIAGFLSVFFWIIYVLCTANTIGGWDELFFSNAFKGDDFQWHGSLQETRIFYGSFQYLIIFSLVGYLSGYVCDKLELFLLNRKLTLTDIFPYKSNSYVLNIFTWLEKVSKSFLLLQIDPQDTKGIILKRLRKLFIIIVTIPLVVLFIVFSNEISIATSENIRIIFIPATISAVFLIWMSYKNGVAIGLWLSLALLFSPAVTQILNTIIQENYDFYMIASNSIEIPSTILTLCVVSWLIGTFSRQLKNEAIKKKLKLAKHNVSNRILPIIHIFILLLLSFECSFKGEWFNLSYNSIFLLALYVSWLSFYYNEYNISNTVFITLLFTCFFSYNYWARSDTTIFSLYFGDNISIPELVYLSSIPYVIKFIQIKKIIDVQKLILLLILTIFIVYVVFSYNSYIIPNIFLTIRNPYSTPLITFFFLICCSQLFVRIIWFFHKKNV